MYSSSCWGRAEGRGRKMYGDGKPDKSGIRMHSQEDDGVPIKNKTAAELAGMAESW